MKKKKPLTMSYNEVFLQTMTLFNNNPRVIFVNFPRMSFNNFELLLNLSSVTMKNNAQKTGLVSPHTPKSKEINLSTSMFSPSPNDKKKNPKLMFYNYQTFKKPNASFHSCTSLCTCRIVIRNLHFFI